MTTISPHAPAERALGGNPHRSLSAATGTETAAPGKSGHSTAARAREILALQAGESGDTRQPFGRTVSQVARGLLSIDDVVALQAETAETDDPASGTAGEQPGAAADAPETPDDSTAGTGTEGAPASFAGTADTQNVLADALEDLLTGETDEPTAV